MLTSGYALPLDEDWYLCRMEWVGQWIFQRGYWKSGKKESKEVKGLGFLSWSLSHYWILLGLTVAWPATLYLSYWYGIGQYELTTNKWVEKPFRKSAFLPYSHELPWITNSHWFSFVHFLFNSLSLALNYSLILGMHLTYTIYFLNY